MNVANKGPKHRILNSRGSVRCYRQYANLQQVAIAGTKLYVFRYTNVIETLYLVGLFYTSKQNIFAFQNPLIQRRNFQEYVQSMCFRSTAWHYCFQECFRTIKREIEGSEYVRLPFGVMSSALYLRCVIRKARGMTPPAFQYRMEFQFLKIGGSTGATARPAAIICDSAYL